jgi:hypothetical protein
MMVYFFHQMQCFLPIGRPHLLLYERRICYTYFAAHDPGLIGTGGKVDELLCKIVPVQHELAVIRAWEGGFAAIPGLSLSYLCSFETMLTSGNSSISSSCTLWQDRRPVWKEESGCRQFMWPDTRLSLNSDHW